MRYDLSFDRKSTALLAICALVIAALLVAAGFLVGMHYDPESTQDQSSSLPGHTAALIPAPKEDESRPERRVSSPAVPPPAPASGTASKAETSLTSTSSQGSPAPLEPAQLAFTLQFGAFNEKANADALLKELKGEDIRATIFMAQDRAGRTWYAVRSGAYATMAEASTAAVTLTATTHQPVLVRPAPTL